MRTFAVWILLALGTCCFADTLNLINDSTFPLRVTIAGADGSLLGEFLLNSRDAAQWSNDLMDLQTNPNESIAPYTVSWYCTGGASFGVCDQVPEGSLVTALSCGGAQECSQPNVTE